MLHQHVARTTMSTYEYYRDNVVLCLCDFCAAAN